MGKYSLRDDIADAIAGRHGGRQLCVIRRQLAALGEVIDRTDIASATRKAQEATAIAWPPPEDRRVTGSPSPTDQQEGNTIMTTDTLAQRLTQVGDALALYDQLHLPRVELATVGVHRATRLAAAFTDLVTRARIVANWAQAFGVPVVLDVHADEVRAHVSLTPDIPAVVYANVGVARLYELRGALGLPVEFGAVAPTEVSAERVLAALATFTQPPAPAAPVETVSVAGDLADAMPVEPAPVGATPADTASAVANA